jgi:hypothetical protein
MPTKAQLEEQNAQYRKALAGKDLVDLDGIGPSGVDKLHAKTGAPYTGGGKPKPKPKRIITAAEARKRSTANLPKRIDALEARVDELEAYEATDEYGQKIYPPNPNHAWSDGTRLFEKARQAWADRNGKELRRRQVAKGQPPR